MTTEPAIPNGWGFRRDFEIVKQTFLDRYYGRGVLAPVEDRDPILEADLNTLNHIISHRKSLKEGKIL